MQCGDKAWADWRRSEIAIDRMQMRRTMMMRTGERDNQSLRKREDETIRVRRYLPRTLLVLRRPVFMARRSRRGSSRVGHVLCCRLVLALMPPRRQEKVVEMCIHIMPHGNEVWLPTSRPSAAFPSWPIETPCASAFTSKCSF
jgi:hypothetical protein